MLEYNNSQAISFIEMNSSDSKSYPYILWLNFKKKQVTRLDVFGADLN
jgi:hypothetical protein